MKLFNIIMGLTFLFISSISLIACGQNKSADKTSDKKTSNFSVIKTNEDWKKELSIEQYKVLREKETERPYTGKLLYNKDKGVYKCAGCGNELFTDEMKFDSHCGWPSFDNEIKKGVIKEIVDNTLGMRRIEITCGKCGGHLGHVFDDGPQPTGKRYCMNSTALYFIPDK
jgi:methionine-R-sulfoxide reductase